MQWNVPGKPSKEALRRLLQGELQHTKIGGFQLRLDKVSKNSARFSMQMVTHEGTVLAEYDAECFEVELGSTVTMANLDRLFTFNVS